MTHSVKLVHITNDAENIISYCARVSNPANQENYDTAPKLLKYCVEHGHWSVFEMVNMCVEINTTRSIAAQILRHRSFSFQEFSQRYAEVAEVAAPPQFRKQDTKNRQNSTDDLDLALRYQYTEETIKLYNQCYNLYQRMLEDGVAKECAREVLPMAAPTRLYMNGSIRSWIHYCQLRCSNGTQLEHRMIANGVYKLLQEHLPSVCAVLAV
jgi:thymidylate synthase (FAD)